jgi:hypothetical protein
MKITLTTHDYQIMAQALDLAARRGAFGAAEMTNIGALHQRLVQVIQQDLPQPEAEPEVKDAE